MKCTNCGFENRPDARFCKQCGQPLPAQPTPPASVICPACGATAKPGALFCPRCGKPLPASTPPPSAAPSMQATQPSMGPLPQPYGPPPTAPAPAKRRPSRWPLWVAGIIAFLCVVGLIVTAIAFRSKLFGGEPTATLMATASPTVETVPTAPPTAAATTAPPPTEEAPPPAASAQVAIAASAAELRVGEILTVSVTITNTGQAPFNTHQYQLVGEWEPFLRLLTEQVMVHEVNVPSGESNTVTFEMEATQAGIAHFHADVTVEMQGEPPILKPISSEQIIEVSVVQ